MSRKAMICIVVILSFISALTLLGCGKSAEQTIENVIGGLIEAENQEIEAGNSSDEVNDYEINDEDSPGSTGDADGEKSMEHQTEWPSDLPPFVPQMDGLLTAAVLTHPEEGIKNYTIAYENLQMLDAEVYEKKLLDNGWTIDGKVDMGETWMIYASIENKAVITIGAEAEDNSGMMNVTIF